MSKTSSIPSWNMHAGLSSNSRNVQATPLAESGTSSQLEGSKQDGESLNTNWLRVLEKICSDDPINDEPYKSHFPFPAKPWTEPVPEVAFKFVSACPPEARHLLPREGLLVEATIAIKVAEMERAVRVAETKVSQLRAREHLLRAHLFQIQTAMRESLLQIADNKIREAVAERQQIAREFENSPIFGLESAVGAN